jgi:transketolase
MAARLDGRDYRVYVLIGDGEADEGQIWEAAMAAAKYQVANLTAILDYNKFQQTGPVSEVMPALEPVVAKWQAFGWYPVVLNGHDMAEILEGFKAVRQVENQPQVIIAHTLKGKGLSAFEADKISRKHGQTLTAEEAEKALVELDQLYKKER